MDIPTYYVVSRHLSKEDAPAVAASLALTPVVCAVISDASDLQLALEFASEVLKVMTDEAAHTFACAVAAKTSRPALVIGDAALLEAVYEDGRREAVPCQC